MFLIILLVLLVLFAIIMLVPLKCQSECYINKPIAAQQPRPTSHSKYPRTDSKSYNNYINTFLQ